MSQNSNFTQLDFSLAGLLHDIGKFLERADVSLPSDWEKNRFAIYCNKVSRSDGSQFFSHKHSLYTAYFFDLFSEFLPLSSDLNSITSLSANHHKPETSFQWIVAMADRIAIGLDKKEFEIYNNSEEAGGKDYNKKIRLLPIWETIGSLDSSTKRKDFSKREQYLTYMPLKALHSDSIYPENKSDEKPGLGDKEEYKPLWNDFSETIKKIPHKMNVRLWIEHFDSLYQKFTYSIPSSSVYKSTEDISLYEHSRLTSAISCALFNYHSDKNDWDRFSNSEKYNENYLELHTENRFLLIQGKWNGIQSYIHSEGGETRKKLAKILRGRSFMVSLFTELAGNMFIEDLGLPVTSLLQVGAGKFIALVGNTENSRNSVVKIEKQINEWLINQFYGEVSFTINFIEASAQDFFPGFVSNLFARLADSLEERKYKPFNNKSYGVFQKYLDGFQNQFDKPLCPYCAKRPSIVSKSSLSGSACQVCYDEIRIGTVISKARFLGISRKPIKGDCDFQFDSNPIFSLYFLSFWRKPDSGRGGQDWIHFWDLSDLGTIEWKENYYTRKFLSPYLPIVSEQGLEKYPRQTDNTDDDMRSIGDPASFGYLSYQGLMQSKDSNELLGVPILSVLSADIDHLGLIFRKGLPSPNLSQVISLGRHLHLYFSGKIPGICKDQFPNVYTVFSGGDDLLQVGPLTESLRLWK